jgi:nitrogen fixation/metabolism regulation signal transduction histidine kinase
MAAAETGHRRAGLTRTLTMIALAQALLAALIAGIAVRYLSSPWIVAALVAFVGVLFALWSTARTLGSVSRTLQAVTDGVRSFRDTDFSMRLAQTRDDELGELVALYNQMGDALRSERHEIYQRELLLDTLLQGAPMAIVLTGSSGRVAYANREARTLFASGRRIEGLAFDELAAACPAGMGDALLTVGDTLLTVSTNGGEEETYRTSVRAFDLNVQRHTLHVVERLTPELRRREVEVWKKAIRVMNHELNNSLAPISSLVHSAQLVMGRPEHAHRLLEIFATIDERARHLTEFLEGYARFARLPQPRLETVGFDAFVERARRLIPFRLEGELPAEDGCFDPSQIEQVLINLLKNAHEAGSPDEETSVSIRAAPGGGVAIRVSDRGRGMDEETMKRALLPFFTSKPAGTGLGLPLCNEILEAHGGRLSLQSRPGGGVVVTCWLPPAAGVPRP